MLQIHEYYGVYRLFFRLKGEVYVALNIKTQQVYYLDWSKEEFDKVHNDFGEDITNELILNFTYFDILNDALKALKGHMYSDPNRKLPKRKLYIKECIEHLEEILKQTSVSLDML